MQAMMEYSSVLNTRYASKEMSAIFSDQKKYTTWRKLWIYLAECQKELGLLITDNQIAQLRDNCDNIDMASAAAYEKELQHDVMAHIHAYGDQAPLARPIIHLGATSCLITDNAEVLIIKEAMLLIRQKLTQLIEQLSTLAREYKDVPCLSYTHFQVAQPTTFGKRISVWLQDFLMDLDDLEYRLKTLKALGIKGATGTQASFLDLLEQDHAKVDRLENMMLNKLGVKQSYSVTGQTYTRKQDIHLVDMLAGIAASAHKFATDFRLLSHLGVIEEPAPQGQVGSSAMPYKRNPILTERICALSRFIISLSENPKYTHCTQWLERGLDDSANRRLVISESCLATDAVLALLIKVTKNPVVYTQKIASQLEKEKPFLLTESILMQSTQKGCDRQTVHEVIRKHSFQVGKKLKEGVASENDLLDTLGNDPAIPFSTHELKELAKNTNLVGRAPQQVELFLKEVESRVGLTLKKMQG